MQSFDGRKPEIDYPCNWQYQVIGLDERHMREIAHRFSRPRAELGVTPRNTNWVTQGAPPALG